MNVKSAQMRAPYETRLIDVKLPDVLGEDQVLLKINACGICGTDLSAAITRKDWGPFGHEVAGTIEGIGAGVRNVSVGQKVVLESSSYCGTCALCRSGRIDLCAKAANFWSQPAMGFSQRMIAPACACVPYQQLSAEVACLAEPAGVAFDLVKTADIQLADRVGVIGVGPIGLMAIAIAARAGASSVAAFSRPQSLKRVELAESLGARIVPVDGSTPFDPALHGQFDRLLVTAPVEVLPMALPLLSYGGVITYIGIGTGNPVISFDANAFHFKKLQLRASHASPAIYFPQVLLLLQTGIIPGEKLVSHRFALQDIQQAMTTCRDDKAAAIKVVVNA